MYTNMKLVTPSKVLFLIVNQLLGEIYEVKVFVITALFQK
jgi:hypothetical protein